MWCPEPGVYEHECPACHRKIVFTVRQGYHLGIGNMNEPALRPSVDGDLNPKPTEKGFWQRLLKTTKSR